MMNLTEAIEKKDIEMIRRRLATYVVANPHDEKKVVQQALRGLNQEQINIWDEKDSFVRKERRDWSKEYLADAYASLKTAEFSKELFHHVIEVGKKLSPVQKSTANRTIHSPKNKSTDVRIERLESEVNELMAINLKKGLSKDEVQRLNELRKIIERLQNQEHREAKGDTSKKTILHHLLEMIKRIFS